MPAAAILAATARSDARRRGDDHAREAAAAQFAPEGLQLRRLIVGAAPAGTEADAGADAADGAGADAADGAGEVSTSPVMAMPRAYGNS